MKTGRPPAWTIDTPGGVAIDVRSVDDRGRLTLPGRILALLSWVEPKQRCACLLVLNSPGQVQVLPWDPFGIKVLEQRRALAELADHEGVLGLDDRYLRSSIAASRIALPDLAITHLEPRVPISTVYLAVANSEFELWSVSYRNERRSKLGAGLEELP